jgi:hypothetical protein
MHLSVRGCFVQGGGQLVACTLQPRHRKFQSGAHSTLKSTVSRQQCEDGIPFSQQTKSHLRQEANESHGTEFLNLGGLVCRGDFPLHPNSKIAASPPCRDGRPAKVQPSCRLVFGPPPSTDDFRKAYQKFTANILSKRTLWTSRTREPALRPCQQTWVHRRPSLCRAKSVQPRIPNSMPSKRTRWQSKRKMLASRLRKG